MAKAQETYSAKETQQRFKSILRGALATKPISDEEIVRRSRSEKPKVQAKNRSSKAHGSTT